MKRSLFILWVILPVLLSVSVVFAKDSPLEIYDKTASLVTERFYDQTFRGLPWKEMVNEYRSQLRASSTDQELENVINDLLENLHASHTEFLSAADQEYHGLTSIFSGSVHGDRIYQIGAWFQHIGSHWFIRNVFPGSVAESNGLKSGDEIVSVNNLELEPVRSFLGGNPVTVAFRRSQDGPIRNVTLNPISESVQEALLKATDLSSKVLMLGSKRIGYFHLWSGTNDEFLSKMQTVLSGMEQSTDELILDLRDGFGGADVRYVDLFLSADPETGKSVIPLYTKPLVVLINNGVRSGKESFAYYLKSNKRALLVGSTTAGHYLGGVFFNIVPSQFALYLAVASDPDGPAIEGKGVTPDVTAEMPLPYSSGEDAPLEKALKLIDGRGDASKYDSHMNSKKGLGL